MGKTINKCATEKEKIFFEKFDSNANLSDNFEDFIKYGFFHFTASNDLKVSKSGVIGEGIENSTREIRIAFCKWFNKCLGCF